MQAIQQNIGFSRCFQVVHPPIDASRKVVSQVESDAQALAVMIAAGGHKQVSVAHAIGKSEGYVSRLVSGKRAVPDGLVDALCRATGSNLLRQFRDMRDALDECDERREVARLAALMARAA